MIEKEIDEQLNYYYKLGESSGLQHASNILLEEASKSFRANDDTTANLLRRCAKVIDGIGKDMDKKARQEYKEFVKTENKDG